MQRPPESLEPALLARGGGRHGGEIRFRCPHPDRHKSGDAEPSARYDCGKCVWYCDVCQAGGGWRVLCQLLELPVARRTRSRAEPSAVYEYRDESGALLRRKLRWEPGFGGRDKSFSWEKPDGKGGWSKCKGDGNPRVLYGSERLPGARDASALVLVVEGEKDADRAAALGLLAVCNPEGAGPGKWKAEYSNQLRGLQVAVVADRDMTGRVHAQSVAAGLRGSAASIRLLELPGDGVKDLSDWVTAEAREGRSREDLAGRLVALVQETPEWEPGESAAVGGAEPEGGQKDDEQRKETQSQVLLRIAEEAGVELFYDPARVAYARVPAGEHREVWPVRSGDLRDWLLHRYFLESGKAPGAQPFHDARNTLEARARCAGEEHEVFVRVASVEGAVYIDLCNPEWEMVEVTASGWRVLQKAPVRFRRTQTMRPLPRPVAGGSLDELRPLINLPNDRAFALLVSFLLAAIGAVGPFPVLVLHGEQGSAKSTLARLVVSLVDPSGVPLRTVPRTERDLMIAANRCRLLAFDNLSGLPPWFSDALCRLSTGGGLSTRELFSDSDEVSFWAMRPVVLNGIDEVVGRQDLVDRSLVLSLPAIPEHRRRPEKDLWAAIEPLRPRLLGALLDAVSCALRRRDQVQLDRTPRMADFAHWIVAAEPALPWPEGLFLDAYESNRGEAVEASLEVDEVAGAIRELIEEGSFEGTARELLDLLESKVTEPAKRSRSWPRNARALSARLGRIAPALRSRGVEVVKGQRRPGTGVRVIQIVETSSSVERHDRHDGHRGGPAEAGTGAPRDAKPAAVTQRDASAPSEIACPDGPCDGRDGCDASFPLESEPSDEEDALWL